MQGVVHSILRDQDTAKGVMDLVRVAMPVPGGFSDPVEMAFMGGEPPPPLSWVEVDTSSASPSCWGISDVESVVYEHFTAGEKANVTSDGAESWDTNWEIRVTGAASLVHSAPFLATLGLEANGVARLTSGNITNNQTVLRKKEGTTPLIDDRMTWIRARFRVDSVANSAVFIGLTDTTGAFPTPSDVVGLFFNATSGLFFQLVAVSSFAGSGTVVPGVTPAATTWYTVDLCASPGEFGALWVDGDGPHALPGENVPRSDINNHLMAQVRSLAPNTKDLFLDYLHLDLVKGFVNPAAFNPA